MFYSSILQNVKNKADWDTLVEEQSRRIWLYQILKAGKTSCSHRNILQQYRKEKPRNMFTNAWYITDGIADQYIKQFF